MQLSAGRSLTRTAAGTHQALVAKLGEVSLDCCHWYSHLSEEKKSSSLLSSTQADVLLFFSSQKYFPALPHTLQPHSPTASARVVVRCSLSSLEAWGIGSRANGSRRKLFSFPDISIFSYKAQATRCFRWGHLFVWNTTAHTCLLAGVGAQVSCGVRFAQPSEMHFVVPLGTSCKFPHVGTC